MRRLLIAWTLCWGLAVNAFAADASPQGLRMDVISGDRSVNSVTSKANVVAPTVRVRSATGVPVPGVHVRFELIGTDRGTFAGDKSTIETETNQRGEATALGYHPMKTGAFTMRAVAVQNSQQLTAEIHQRNHTEPYSIYREHKTSKVVWAVVGAAAAGLVIGLVLKSRGSGSSATISVGSPTVGGPH